MLAQGRRTMALSAAVAAPMCPCCLSQQHSENTRLLFCTTGILLRMITSGDITLQRSKVTHIILDEVHERDR